MKLHQQIVCAVLLSGICAFDAASQAPGCWYAQACYSAGQQPIQVCPGDKICATSWNDTAPSCSICPSGTSCSFSSPPASVSCCTGNWEPCTITTDSEPFAGCCNTATSHCGVDMETGERRCLTDDYPTGPSCPETGHPVGLMFGNTKFNATDFSAATGTSNFAFQRSYSTRGIDWSYDKALDAVPRPFGTGHAGPLSVEWWHNYISVVTVAPPYRNVRLPGGKLLAFKGCTAPCANELAPYSASSLDELETTTTGYVLRRHSGEYLVFEGGSGFAYEEPKQFFLTKILNETGATTTEIIYDTPIEAINPDGGARLCMTGETVSADGGKTNAPSVTTMTKAKYSERSR